MPIYEYRCMDCRRQYEKREGFDASALQRCPNCGGSARRVIHAAPIVFKGSGFYVTDNRKSAPAAEAEASIDTPATSSSSADKDTAEPAAAG